MIEDDIFKIIVPLDNNFSADFGSNEKKSKSSENSNVKLTETQKKIIEELKKDNTLSAAELSDKIDVSTRTIEFNIKQLKEVGLLVRKGANKNGVWEVN